MQRDPELDAWREQWYAQDAVVDDLRRRVERDIRERRAGLAAAIVVTVCFGLGVPLWAIVSGRMDVAVLAAGVWAFIAITWTVSWWLDRHVSLPATASTAQYLEFCIANCRRRRTGIAAASVLYALMFSFNVAWVYQTRPRPGGFVDFLMSPRLLVAYIVTLALAIAAVRASRRLGRELDNLLELRRQVAWPGSNSR